MSEVEPFNLFVYGTLMNPSVFRAVLGRRLVFEANLADGTETFLARRAVLDGYKKVSPDSTYLYAVPDPHGRIHGYVMNLLPGECMEALREYEGKNYTRRILRVQTARGVEKAVVFRGNLKQMQHWFGHEFRDHLKQEILLEQKIDVALSETEREQLHTGEAVSRRVVAELRGSKIRDIIRRHFEAGGISDYTIRRSLKETPLPDFSRIVKNAEAVALAPNYLAMVVRQVIFNELEEYIHHDFRYELDRMDRSHVYYERAVSSLVALRMLNDEAPLLQQLVEDCLSQLDFANGHLTDYVRWGVNAATAFYDTSRAKRELDFLRNHVVGGHTPLGAELEFSNIGQDVIRDPDGHSVQDARFDSFIYFRDFALDVLTWKLGGHLDDHHEKVSDQPRRGFFEVALGSLSIEADISKPITDDPWLLSQFIHHVRQFYQVSPHSVHISLQIRGRRPAQNRLVPLSVMKCLFALAGDPVRLADGSSIIRRLVADEIITTEPCPQMMFSEISRRRSISADDDYPFVRRQSARGRYVQQFKFLRLSNALNYEPIIMALKGVQLSLSPGSFLMGEQYEKSRKHRDQYEAIVAWGRKATPLTGAEIGEFLSAVHDGLHNERKDRPAHSGAYIAWSISQLRESLGEFNELIQPNRADSTDG